MSATFIPVCRVFLAGNELSYASDAVKSSWISSSGEYITKLESSFAKFIDTRYSVTCANGTAAVHLALIAAGVQAGDRVVVPSFTMMASVFPIVSMGAIPVFVDCEPDTWNMDPKVLANVTGDVKAIMPVHIYGHPCDMDPILSFASLKKASVIEDAAEAHGAIYKGQKIGSIGNVAAFSFYANKIITSGEGGIVTTNDQDAADRVRYYKNLCFDKDPNKRFIHEDIGFNYRMTNVHAAIALAQVEQAEHLIDLRRKMAQKYLERLSHLQDFIQLPVEKPWAKNVYWMFGIVLKSASKLSAPELQKLLLEKGVDTRRFFYPGHLQPCLQKYITQPVIAPVSEHLWENGLYLPSSSDLSENEADYVAQTLEDIIRK